MKYFINKFLPKNQEKIQVNNLALYYFSSCPFCHLVLTQAKKLNLDIELRDIHQDESHKRALIEGGGKKTVPCLQIQHDDGSVEWMYESLDIAAYLRAQFSP